MWAGEHFSHAVIYVNETKMNYIVMNTTDCLLPWSS